MSTYGVVPEGFVVKPIAVILAERERAMINAFGPTVIQTAQSPLGQINGVLSELEGLVWELAQATYQSYDPDQSEGVTLDTLARLRLIARTGGETDATLRRAITNTGTANIRDADFFRAITNVEGVTYARIYANDSGITDEQGVTGHSVSVIALGGDDEEIAVQARRYIVPGISSFGNTRVETEIEGFCRSVFIMRPTEIPLRLALTVVKRNDRNGCPAPSNVTIAEALYLALSGANRPNNGEDVTLHMIKTAISCAFPSVEVVTATAGTDAEAMMPLPYPIDFDEIVKIDLANITVDTA